MKAALKKIEILDVNNKILIASTKLNFSEDRILVFGDDFIVLNHGTKLRALGYLEDGVIMITGKVTLSTEYQINMDVISFGEKKERRKYLKIRTNFEAALLKAYGSVGGKPGLIMNEAVRIRDISLGGICFYSNKLIFRKQHIAVDLYPIKRGLITEALIIRREQINGGSYRYRYGCKFVNLNRAQEEVICRYVFRMQIENHKKYSNKDAKYYNKDDGGC